MAASLGPVAASALGVALLIFLAAAVDEGRQWVRASGPRLPIAGQLCISLGCVALAVSYLAPAWGRGDILGVTLVAVGFALRGVARRQRRVR